MRRKVKVEDRLKFWTTDRTQLLTFQSEYRIDLNVNGIRTLFDIQPGQVVSLSPDDELTVDPTRS